MELQAEDDPRFGGIERLYGRAGGQKLAAAHVCVMGIGGVGSWTVEALARTGVGRLTLVDLDEICLTNVNRQIHALTDQVGRAKVEAMADRVRAIHPRCVVEPVSAFFTAKTAEGLLATPFDCVVDAFDHPRNKALLIARCRAAGIPVVTVGGAGGRRDPAAIKRGSLTTSIQDGLLRRVRKLLRREFAFGPSDWGIPAVFSTEVATAPEGVVCTPEGEDAADSADAEGVSLRIDCATGYGTAAFVTGTFGFHAAAAVVDVVLAR